MSVVKSPKNIKKKNIYIKMYLKQNKKNIMGIKKDINNNKKNKYTNINIKKNWKLLLYKINMQKKMLIYYEFF